MVTCELSSKVEYFSFNYCKENASVKRETNYVQLIMWLKWDKKCRKTFETGQNIWKTLNDPAKGNYVSINAKVMIKV